MGRCEEFPGTAGIESKLPGCRRLSPLSSTRRYEGRDRDDILFLELGNGRFISSERRLARHGWTKDSLRPGDQVTIFGNRKKDGSTNMRLLKLVLSNGQELDGYR
jgi:hypothetical protein